jgi:hypothetical protein
VKKVILPIIAGIAITIAIISFIGLNYNTNSLDSATEPTLLSTEPPKFSSPVKISQSGSKSQPAPDVVFDDSGKMYVLYQDTEHDDEKDAEIESENSSNSGHGSHSSHGLVTNLYMKTSVDNGKTFSESVRVNTIDGDVVLDGRVAPSIEIGNNGEIYVLWANSKPEPNLFMGVYRTLEFAKSTDGGNSFEPAVNIAADELPSGKFFQTMTISGDGNIHVAWLDSPAINNGTGYLISDKSRPSTVKYTKSTDGGNTFEPTKPLDENPCPCCNVQSTSDENNNVYVSWRKVFGSGETQVRDMVVVSSLDSGETFSSPIKISEDNFNFDGCVHVGAPMSVDSKGNLHVVWYTGKTDAPGMYYATSSDNGKTFSEPLAILATDWVPPQRIYLSIDDNDVVWITWEELTTVTTNDTIWRYGETQANIFTAQVKDGNLIKNPSPVNISGGKSPAIDSYDNKAAIVWTDLNNSIMSVVSEN